MNYADIEQAINALGEKVQINNYVQVQSPEETSMQWVLSLYN